MAASMVGRTYTYTSVQCSPASVGLAQARPKYLTPEDENTKVPQDGAV